MKILVTRAELENIAEYATSMVALLQEVLEDYDEDYILDVTLTEAALFDDFLEDSVGFEQIDED